MTFPVDRVKEALEKHGYRQWGKPSQPAADRGKLCCVHLGGRIPAESKWVSVFQATSHTKPWKQALRRFLRDKSMTGARLKDLQSIEIFEKQGGFFTKSHMTKAWAQEDDPNEAIARLWCEVKGIPWPGEA